MAIVSRFVPVGPERVFAVLADGWTYSDWVVGSAHIRDVDPGWPAPDTRIHHTVGPWPFSIDDSSVVLACEPPSELVLQVRAWPLGEARVTFRLTATDGGTTVTMTEEPNAGTFRWVQTKLNDLVLHRRNRESLRRLGDLAAGRPSPDA